MFLKVGRNTVLSNLSAGRISVLQKGMACACLVHVLPYHIYGKICGVLPVKSKLSLEVCERI